MKRTTAMTALALTMGSVVSCHTGARFVSGTPKSIDVFLFYTKYRHSITNSAACADIVRTLETARLGSEHKCAATGEFTLRYPDGHDVEIKFLAGDDDARYEFRFAGQLYTLSRQTFLESLRHAGVDVESVLAEEHALQ